MLARNVIWNFVGTCLPPALALVTFPVLVRDLGKDRFGVLTLLLAVVGYFTMIDLGLTPALTQAIAKNLRSGDDSSSENPSRVWTSLFLMLVLGLLGAGAIALAAPWLVEQQFWPKFPELWDDAKVSFLILGGTIPLVVLSNALEGIMTAHQRFGVLAAVRVPLGIASMLLPILVSTSLTAVVAVISAVRAVAWVAYGVVAGRVLRPFLATAGGGAKLRRDLIGPLLRFGGWMTVFNVVGKLIEALDRIVVGKLCAPIQLAYYSMPYEPVTKLSLIPNSVSGVMFPAFAMNVDGEPERSARHFKTSVKLVFLLMFPVALVLVTLAYDAMGWWIRSEEFARNSAPVIQALAVGVWINSLAQTPVALLKGAGRPDLMGKIVLIELPVFAAALWAATSRYGIEGTAWTWAARVSIDTPVIFYLAQRRLPAVGVVNRKLLIAAVAGAGALVGGAGMWDLKSRLLFLCLALPAFALGAWIWALTPDERRLVWSR